MTIAVCPAGKSDLLGLPKQIDLGQNDALLYVASMDQRQFQPDLFSIHNVEIPEQISGAVQKRQAEFFAGRLLAKDAMMALGFPACQLPIGSDHAPVWPPGLQGAVSHTDTLCAVLLTAKPRQTVGIDVEAALSENAIRSIVRIVLDDNEIQKIEASALPTHVAIAAAFSAKETIYKALFPKVGAFFGFDAVRLQNIRKEGLAFSLKQDLSLTLVVGARIDVHLHLLGDYVLTWLLHDA